MAFLWLLAGFWQLQVQARKSTPSRPRAIASSRCRCRRRAAKCSTATAASWSTTRRASSCAFRAQSSTAITCRSSPKGSTSPTTSCSSGCSELRNSRAPEYQPISIKEDLTPTEVAFVEAHRAEFPELELMRSQRRLYPQGGLGGARDRLCRRGQRGRSCIRPSSCCTTPARRSARPASNAIQRRADGYRRQPPGDGGQPRPQPRRAGIWSRPSPGKACG